MFHEKASSFLNPWNEIVKLSLTSQATRTTRRRFVWEGPEACRKAADTGVRRAPVRSACTPRDLLRYKMWKKLFPSTLPKHSASATVRSFFMFFFCIFSCWIPTNADRFLSHCFHYVKLLKKRNTCPPRQTGINLSHWDIRWAKKKQQLGCYMGFWRIRCPCRSRKSLTKRSGTWNQGKLWRTRTVKIQKMHQVRHAWWSRNPSSSI